MPLTAFLATQIGLGALMIFPFYLLEWVITQQTPAPTPTNFAALVYVVFLPSLAAYFAGIAVSSVRGCSADVLRQPDAGVCSLPSWALLADPIGVYHLVEVR